MNHLSDLLTRIRNGQQIGLSQIKYTFSDAEELTNFQQNTLVSKGLFSVLTFLRKEGFIRGYSYVIEHSKKHKKCKNRKKVKKQLMILLKYQTAGTRVIRDVDSVSTKGRRVFLSSAAFWQPQSNTGAYALSTSRGVLSDGEARRLNVGGEVLFSVV